MDDEEIFEEELYVHVYPLFGKEHALEGVMCWCEPEQDVENSNVIIHHPEQ